MSLPRKRTATTAPTIHLRILKDHVAATSRAWKPLQGRERARKGVETATSEALGAVPRVTQNGHSQQMLVGMGQAPAPTCKPGSGRLSHSSPDPEAAPGPLGGESLRSPPAGRSCTPSARFCARWSVLVPSGVEAILSAGRKCLEGRAHGFLLPGSPEQLDMRLLSEC